MYKDRRVSCKDLGQGDCEGWLYKIRNDKGGAFSSKWVMRWCVMKNYNMFYYKNKTDQKAEGMIHLPAFQVSPALEVKTSKFAFKVHNLGTSFLFSSDRQEDMKKWMIKLGSAAIAYYKKKVTDHAIFPSSRRPTDYSGDSPDTPEFSESDDDQSDSPNTSSNTSTSSSLGSPESGRLRLQELDENEVVSLRSGRGSGCSSFTYTVYSAVPTEYSEEPKKVTISTEDTKVLKGSSLILTCTFNGESKPSAVLWTRYRESGEDIQLTPDKYSGGTVDTPSLTVHHVGAEDSGVYVCKLTFEGDQVSSNPLTINVDTTSAVLSEETNYLRIYLLCLNIGTDSVRHYFDSHVPPGSLHGHLSTHEHNLRYKQPMKCNKDQLNLLFPAIPMLPASSTFNFSLLYKLTRNTLNVPQPARGWGFPPQASDISDEDDVERIRKYRNLLAHIEHCKIEQGVFSTMWTELSQAIQRLSKGSLTTEVNDLEHKRLDQDIRSQMVEDILQFRKDVKDLQQEVEDIIKSQKDQQARIESLEAQPVPQHIPKHIRDREYPSNIEVDGCSTDLIVDRRLEWSIRDILKQSPKNKNRDTLPTCTKTFDGLYYKLLADEIQYRGKLVIEEILNKIRNAVEFQDGGIMCRYFLSKISNTSDSITVNQLRSYLQLALKIESLQCAKAIGWKLAKIFVKTTQLKYYDVWPGLICECSSDTSIKTGEHIFCSDKITIVVEINEPSDEIEVDNFNGIPLKFKVLNGVSSEAKFMRAEINKNLPEIEKGIKAVEGCGSDRAKELFVRHTKLSLLSKSPLKSVFFGKQNHRMEEKPCIQLFCRVKGIIPLGENHFPKEVNSVPTDVIEGYSEFLAKVCIGSEICNFENRKSGTLGGFVRHKGHDAFLTCAHVLLSREQLAVDADQSSFNDTPTFVHCRSRNANEWFTCGELVDHHFPPDKSLDGVTIDAAIVRLNTTTQPTAEEFGLPNDYLNNIVLDYKEVGVITTLHMAALGAVSTPHSKPGNVRLEETNKIEFETLCQLLERTGDMVRNGIVTDDVHARINAASTIEKKTPRIVEFYNQISIGNVGFKPGDSGMCIYACVGERKGCIGMAIATHPDGSGCIVTPLKSIMSIFKMNKVK